MHEIFILFATLVGAIALFIWGYWRYDVVASFALMILILTGVVPFSHAFSGLSNPAVITVACVMVLTQAVTQSGIIDYAVKKLAPLSSNTLMHCLSLSILTAILSAFMNNVGALALMMPVAIQTSIKNNRSPSLMLMPIAFASVLGGLTTAIGTPPNLLISSFRLQVTGHAFKMFDFSPVGVVVAIVAILFIGLVGWRLVPQRKPASGSTSLFEIEDYISELSINDESPVVGLSLREFERNSEADFSVLGLIRGKRKRLVLRPYETLQAKDILIIEATHDEIDKLKRENKLELVGTDSGTSSDILATDDVSLIEVVVPQGGRIEGRSWQQMRIRSRFRINLLAISRQGKAFQKRLNHVNLRAGDVLLLQGESENLAETTTQNLGLLPLQERGVTLTSPKKAIISIALFVLAIGCAALQILPVQISFAAAVLAMIMLNILSIRKVYSYIDWSIIVLLAAMIPVGSALQSTGATLLIAKGFLSMAGSFSPFIIIGLLLLITMTLSDIMNNAATAVVMAPIAISIAQGMNAVIDPFLMAVAVGASCSFLTPISHQNNTLVMGPGGYKFFDYMRLGIPIEIIVLAVGLPMIMLIWPF